MSAPPDDRALVGGAAADDPATVAVTAAAESLAAEAGLDAVALGERAVERAVRARVVATGLSPAAWADRLRRDAAERTALIDAVVVPETQLFRDGSPFEALRALAAARVAGAAGATMRRPMRVLSAACSTGEEPYSVAIALLAGGLPAPAVEVVAIDVSRAALGVAATGVLGRTALRGRVPDWAEAWLERRPDGTVVVAPTVRSVVELRAANVLSAPEDGPYDAILCRNLLIYLTPPARARVSAWLRAQLGPGGPLFVGHAEVGVLLGDGWHRDPVQGPYALRPVERPEMPTRAPAAAAPAAPLAAAAPPSPPATPPAATAAPPSHAAAASPPGSAPGPMPPPSDAPPVAVSATPAATPSVDDRRAAAAALAEAGARDDAIRLLDALLLDAPSDVEACALLGILHATAGRPDAARVALRRALYLDPDHAESRAQLALLDAARPAGGRP